MIIATIVVVSALWTIWVESPDDADGPDESLLWAIAMLAKPAVNPRSIAAIRERNLMFILSSLGDI